MDHEGSPEVGSVFKDFLNSLLELKVEDVVNLTSKFDNFLVNLGRFLAVSEDLDEVSLLQRLGDYIDELLKEKEKPFSD